MGIFSFRKSTSDKFWYRLDNAAKIYPAVSNKFRTSVFRISVELVDPIKPEILQDALDITIREFPYFRSHLKKGFFWYWLEKSESSPVIKPDFKTPCRSFNLQRRNHLLIRVLARNSNISVEFSHILTDGGGGMQFLTRMLYHYGKLCGWNLPTEYIDPPIGSQEYEDLHKDAYVSNFLKQYPKPNKISKAFHLTFDKDRHPNLSVISAELNSSEIKKAAKEKQVTITEFLAATYLFTMQKFYFAELEKGNKPKNSILRVQIPVNLRKLYNYNTIRNFALFIMIEIDPRLGAYSFDEIIQTVHHYMQLETDRKQIQRIITRNVGGERHPLIRVMPLMIKVPMLYLFYKNSGPLLYSGVLTNLGMVKLPESYDPYIKSFRFVAPPPDPGLKVNSAVVSYKDKMIFTFGNQSKSKDFEKEFFRFLVEIGIQVKILN